MAVRLFDVCLFMGLSCSVLAKYEPTWESLDKRPLPEWYDEAKLGIFITWGLYSVPSYGSEWFWYYWQHDKLDNYVDFMQNNYPPGFTYPDFAKQFTAEFYDPDHWADVFEKSGAKYIVLTTKHHEGYTLWPSKYSWDWNAMDVGPHRDLVGGLADSLRKRTNIHLGLYHSLFEWFNPLYNDDKENNFKTTNFVKSKTMPELYELVNTYKPDVVWSDGDAGPDVYWNSTGFLAWLYNESPVKDTVVTNDRWGSGCECKHGGYYTCQDRYNPGVLVKHKWENCMTIGPAWGYTRNSGLSNFQSIQNLIKTLAETVSCGGNLLMNVGPTHDGRIIPVYEERLLQMGEWLGVNGEAIFKSKPWSHQNDTLTKGLWYTSRTFDTGLRSVYAIMLSWPKNNTLTLGAPVTTPQTTVSMLGYPGNLTWKARPGGGIVINIPYIAYNKMPCKWAWVMKLDHLDVSGLSKNIESS